MSDKPLEGELATPAEQAAETEHYSQATFYKAVMAMAQAYGAKCQKEYTDIVCDFVANIMDYAIVRADGGDMFAQIMNKAQTQAEKRLADQAKHEKDQEELLRKLGQTHGVVGKA